MNERHRILMRLELLQIAPFAGALLLMFPLAAMRLLVWQVAVPLLVCGFGASLVLTIMAARGRGPFAGAPLMLKVRAKMWLVDGLYVACMPIILGVAQPVVSKVTFQILQAAGFLGAIALFFGPMLGYGPLGRELTAATKEEERASWRN